MQHHRFTEQMGLMPQPALTTCSAARSAFVACPAVLVPGGLLHASPWQQIYQAAYERAKAVVAPSRLERLLVASPN